MMVYTTYTAAVQFRKARKPKFPQADGRTLIEPAVPGFERLGAQERRVPRLVTEPAAMR